MQAQEPRWVRVEASRPGRVRSRPRGGDMVKRVEVAPGGHLLQHTDGTPFFWLGDTGWLLLSRLRREEAAAYLDDRRAKGYTVVQAMVIHGLPTQNAYGRAPCVDVDPGQVLVASGHDPADPQQADYWDHVDHVLELAAARGIHLALVPAWGGVAKRGHLHLENAARYGGWLGRRYRDRPNVFWINGGDIRGDQHTAVWHALGTAIKEADPDHLMTFHPFGRTKSSQWFQDAPWLDFHMCQSGHRRYDQDAQGYGEDNWRYIRDDYALQPARPVLDGEPSYEGIPQGLHDPREPFWEAADARRYAYWAVFAGACGHTYGHGAVMQMLAPRYGRGGYGVTKYWYDAVQDPGAGQMLHLRRLIESRPFFARVPDEDSLAGAGGQRYERILATRGADYLFAYTYTGRPLPLRLGVLPAERLRAWWYNPRDGRSTPLGEVENRGARTFTPPSPAGPGQDWVLVLDDAARGFPAPGSTA